MCLFMAGILEMERRPSHASGHDRRLGKHDSGHDLVLILRSRVRHVAGNHNTSLYSLKSNDTSNKKRIRDSLKRHSEAPAHFTRVLDAQWKWLSFRRYFGETKSQIRK